jgi:copper homeostasis protein
VVVGALAGDGGLDVEALTRFIDAADAADVTVHRAVDAAADPVAAAVSSAGLGVRRVLTSGGAADCRAGHGGLGAMCEATGGSIEIMAGGGVRIGDIPSLAAAGVDAVHLSARRAVTRGAGGPGGGADAFDATDERLVVEAVAAARDARQLLAVRR